MKPKISVVVPAYNEEELLPGCLDSLLNQEIPKGLCLEVIVVDNASTDRTFEKAKAKGVRVIKEERKGYVNALIAGAKAAKGEIIAFTDADTRVPKNWLAKFLSQFEKDPQLVAVGGVFRFFDGNFFLRLSSLASKYFIFSLTGSNMAIKKEALEKVGGFNKKVNLGTDTELSIRIRKVGRLLIDKKNVVCTSSRRYAKDSLRSFPMFFGNGVSLLLLHKPLFFDFPDIRPKKGRKNSFFRLSFAFLLVFFVITIGFPSIIHSQGRFQKNKTTDKIIALTFDDGPDPIITPKVLSILKEKHVPATFFLIGSKVHSYPSLVKEIVDEGQVVGNHSFFHHWYSGVEAGKLMRNDFLKSEEEIEKVTGKRPKFVRAPHGIISLWFLQEMKNYNFTVIDWNLDPKDWEVNTDASKIVKFVEKNVKPGSIVLLHDGLDRKIGRQTETLQVLPAIIEELEAKGYTFVSLADLLQSKPYF